MTEHPRDGVIELDLVPEVDGGALVFVTGLIGDGSGPNRHCRFLLDTGSARTWVGSSDLPGGIVVAADAPTSKGAFGQAGDASGMATVPRLTVGPIVRTGQVVHVSTDDAGLAHPALLGMDVLGVRPFLLDLPGRHLTIDAPPTDVAVGRVVISPATRSHIHVPVGIGSRERAMAVWDTGASMTVVDTGLVARHPDRFVDDGESAGTDATGATFTTPLYRMTGLAIGGFAFAAHRVAAFDFAPLNASTPERVDLILGVTTLELARWWVDMPRGELAVLPAP